MIDLLGYSTTPGDKRTSQITRAAMPTLFQRGSGMQLIVWKRVGELSLKVGSRKLVVQVEKVFARHPI